MGFLYLKAAHIIFIVTWFSGMFYLVRLFIYNREAADKPEPAQSILHHQFGIMITRLLFGITWPSAILTLILGAWLLYLIPSITVWLQIKLAIVILLFAYHYSLHSIYLLQKRGHFSYSSYQLRMWNEVPTVLLVAIVFLAVVKTQISLLYGLVGIILLTAMLILFIRLYKFARRKSISK